MATLHLLKDGKTAGGGRLTRSIDVSINLAVGKLATFHRLYSEHAPTINENIKASEWADYKHVVLEVGEDEASAPFSKAGYYYLEGLSPAESMKLIGDSGPSF